MFVPGGVRAAVRPTLAQACKQVQVIVSILQEKRLFAGFILTARQGVSNGPE